MKRPLIETKQLAFKEFLSVYPKIEIPPYQRPYTWGTQQVIDFLDDLFASIKIDRENKPELVRQHFMGNVFIRVNSDQKSRSVAELIDGQQRITTAFLLYVALYKKMTKYDKGKDFNRSFVEDYVEFLPRFSQVLFDAGDNFNPLKLKLGSIDQDQLINLTLDQERSLFESTYDEESEIDYEDAIEDMDQREIEISKLTTSTIIYKNFKTIDDYLEDKIHELRKEKKEGDVSVIPEYSFSLGLVFDLIDYSFTHTLLINNNIINGNDGLAYLMFEALNARGLALNEIDKLKNKVFYITFDTQNQEKYDQIKAQWASIISKLDNKAEGYLRDFFMIEFKKSFSKKNLYSDFLKQIESNNDKGNFVTSLIARAEKYSKYYKFILTNNVSLLERLYDAESNGKKYVVDIRQEVSFHANFKILRPVILKALINYESDKIDEEKLYKICKLASNLLIYFQLSQQSIGRFEGSLPNIIKQSLIKNDVLDYDLLKSKIQAYDESKYYRILSDLINNKSLVKERLLSLYDFDTNAILVYKLERHKSNQTTHVFKKKKFQIEHVWPTSYNNIPDWEEKEEIYLEGAGNSTKSLLDHINSIGNLAVLDSTRNTKCKNKSFNLKKVIYNENKDLRLVNELAKYDDFDINTIFSRKEELVNYLLENKLLDL